MFDKIIEFMKDMLGLNKSKRPPQRNEFIIQLKNSSVGKLSRDDLEELGYFDNYGTSGALQGKTLLSRDELIEYLVSHFNLPKEDINIINPRIYWQE